MGEGMYRTMYPTGCTAPKFYRLPKIHKTGTPSGKLYPAGAKSPMGWLKSLLRYLKLLVGKLPHHIQSTWDFVSGVKEVTLLLWKCLNSYDVSVLFTSVPIDPSLNIIKDILEYDDTLWDGSVLSEHNIIKVLGFCLHYTYFCKNKFYEQVEGVAMGSLVSPIVANLYMEHFEREALNSASTTQVLV